MKSLIIGLAIVFSLWAGVVSANNGCGLGYAPRSRFSLEWKKYYTPPFFVVYGIDGDGKVEGRADSWAMYYHDLCVETK